MGDAAKARDLVAKADKKLGGWGLFGNKYEDALELLEKAANQLKLAKARAAPARGGAAGPPGARPTPRPPLTTHHRARRSGARRATCS